MLLLCLLGLHDHVNKETVLEKRWFLVSLLEQRGFKTTPVATESINVQYRECRRCGHIKPR